MKKLKLISEKMQTKANSKTGVSFKVNLFSSFKKSIWTVFFLRGLRQGRPNNLIPAAFLFFGVKDEVINRLHYFAHLSSI